MAKTQKYEFDVVMTCSGCSGAVNRVLSRMDGVHKIDISLEEQRVNVEADRSYDDVLATIKKTGKEVKGGKEVI